MYNFYNFKNVSLFDEAMTNTLRPTHSYTSVCHLKAENDLAPAIYRAVCGNIIGKLDLTSAEQEKSSQPKN